MEIHEIVLNERVEKEWYTTNEVAKLIEVAQYTVQERWCNQGRIECEKDPRPASGEYPETSTGGSERRGIEAPTEIVYFSASIWLWPSCGKRCW